jgi:hypothetical protein
MGKDKQRCLTYISALREGYVIGDGSVFAGGKMVERRRSTCVPDSDQMSDGPLVAKVFTAMTLDFGGFPEDRNLPAPGFLIGVMIHAFPCVGAR